MMELLVFGIWNGSEKFLTKLSAKLKEKLLNQTVKQVL